ASTNITPLPSALVGISVGAASMTTSAPSSRRATFSKTSVRRSRSSGIGLRRVHSHAPGRSDASIPELYPPLPLDGGPQNCLAIRIVEDMNLQDNKKRMVRWNGGALSSSAV